MSDDKVNTEAIMKGITDSFALPWQDLYNKKHESEWRNLVDGFSGNFAFNYPLKDTVRESRGADGEQLKEDFRKSTLTATLSYNPLSYWFATATAYTYWDLESNELYSPESKADWDPDFTYSFGYADWHPFTLGLAYSNFGANRFNPDKEVGEKHTKFDEGTYALNWNFIIPRALEELFIVHESGGVAGSIAFNLTPSFQNLATMSEESWKQSVTLNIKYTIYKWWYFTFTLYYYPKSWHRQPWDPDFTYGFGYFDWHPGAFSIQYNNYAGNRYPWDSSDDEGAGFDDGALTISWSWKL
jgi:hypothetical protein